MNKISCGFIIDKYENTDFTTITKKEMLLVINALKYSIAFKTEKQFVELSYRKMREIRKPELIRILQQLSFVYESLK